MKNEFYANECETLIIPEDLSNIKLPDPTLLNYFNDAAKRTYFIEDEIDSSTMEIVKTIYRYNIEDRGVPPEQRTPILLFIDSVGGDVQVMWCVVNAIRLSKTPVYTIALCNCMSAAAHILAAGHKRFALPGATILIHSGSCSFGGDVEKVESAKKYYDTMSNNANLRLIEQTKILSKDLKKKGSVDWYMTPEEALAYGMIDKIIDDFEDISR